MDICKYAQDRTCLLKNGDFWEGRKLHDQNVQHSFNSKNVCIQELQNKEIYINTNIFKNS